MSDYTGNYEPLGTSQEPAAPTVEPTPEPAPEPTVEPTPEPAPVPEPGTEPSPAGFPDGAPFESTPVNPTPTDGDVGSSGLVATPAGPAVAPVVARPLYPTGETFEQKAVGLLQTIRSNGLNQVLTDEIDTLLNWYHHL